MVNLPWLDLSNCSQHHFGVEVVECQSKRLPTLGSQQMGFYFLASLYITAVLKLMCEEARSNASRHEYMNKEHGQKHISYHNTILTSTNLIIPNPLPLIRWIIQMPLQQLTQIPHPCRPNRNILGTITHN